jgi:hypothetical protein
LKIIDVDQKGQLVKFYLADDDLEEWTGDDWNDTPFEHNAGSVYDEYVCGELTVVYKWDDLVIQPDWGLTNSSYCKDDMIARRIYALCVLKTEDRDKSDYAWRADMVAGNSKAIRIYMGDTVRYRMSDDGERLNWFLNDQPFPGLIIKYCVTRTQKAGTPAPEPKVIWPPPDLGGVDHGLIRYIAAQWADEPI